jgi:hypothetical protein
MIYTVHSAIINFTVFLTAFELVRDVYKFAACEIIKENGDWVESGAQIENEIGNLNLFCTRRNRLIGAEH